jgi:hypothetical protein
MLVLLLGCGGQTQRAIPLAADQTGELPRRSVLVKKSGERVRFEQGRVSGDSVTGILRTGEHFSVPRDSVALEKGGSSGEAFGVTAFFLALLVGGALLGAATGLGH